jgi:hypothetical protein
MRALRRQVRGHGARVADAGRRPQRRPPDLQRPQLLGTDPAELGLYDRHRTEPGPVPARFRRARDVEPVRHRGHAGRAGRRRAVGDSGRLSDAGAGGVVKRRDDAHCTAARRAESPDRGLAAAQPAGEAGRLRPFQRVRAGRGLAVAGAGGAGQPVRTAGPGSTGRDRSRGPADRADPAARRARDLLHAARAVPGGLRPRWLPGSSAPTTVSSGPVAR